MSTNRNLPETMISPETGEVLRRGVRPFVVSYGGQSITVNLPGYYSDREDDGVLIGEDMNAVDEALKKLKAPKNNLK